MADKNQSHPSLIRGNASDCLNTPDKAKWGMIEHIKLLEERGLPIVPKNSDPQIIIQNQRKMAIAA